MFWPRRKPVFTVPDGEVLYAVGDIHGRLDLLKAVTARIDADFQESGAGLRQEVYLGDYVDRGPDTAEVLKFLIERLKQPGVCCLKGNHEAMLNRFLSGEIDLASWAPWGGLPTLQSYGVAPGPEAAGELNALMPGSHHEFLRSLPISHSAGDYFFVHAGVRPGQPLEMLTEEDALWIRADFLSSRRAHGAMVVHGHTPVEDVEFLPNRINIDTGAWITGKLSCLRVDATGARLLEPRL